MKRNVTRVSPNGGHGGDGGDGGDGGWGWGDGRCLVREGPLFLQILKSGGGRCQKRVGRRGGGGGGGWGHTDT